MDSNFHVHGEVAGGKSYYAGVMTPTMGLDESYINCCYSGIGFQPILQPFPSPNVDGGVCFYPPPQMAVPLASAPATFGFFNHEFQASEAPKAIAFFKEEIKPPKQEALSAEDLALEFIRLNTPAAAASGGSLINFFATSSSANSEISTYNGDSYDCYTHLPLFESFEQQESPGEAQNAFKINQNHPLTFQFNDSSASISLPNNRVNNSPSAPISRYLPYNTSELAKTRRRKLSEKTRCLQKLLPWDKKMDMATMFEEAHKYIKFLQAQIRVLQSMPSHSSGNPNPNTNNEVKNENISSSSGSSRNDVVYIELGRLNRQQLLEVVVNSPVAQTVLYSRGCCVYSMEQLLLLKKMAEKKALLEQMLLSSFLY